MTTELEVGRCEELEVLPASETAPYIMHGVEGGKTICGAPYRLRYVTPAEFEAADVCVVCVDMAKTRAGAERATVHPQNQPWRERPV